MPFLFIDLPNPMMMTDHASFEEMNPKEIVVLFDGKHFARINTFIHDTQLPLPMRLYLILHSHSTLNPKGNSENGSSPAQC